MIINLLSQFSLLFFCEDPNVLIVREIQATPTEWL